MATTAFDVIATLKAAKPNRRPKTYQQYEQTLRTLHGHCVEAAAAVIQTLLARGRQCQPRAKPDVPPMQDLQWLASPTIVERGLAACKVAPGTRARYLTKTIVALRIALGAAACEGAAYQRWESDRDAIQAALASIRATREWTAKEQRNRISAAEARGAIHAPDKEMVAMMKATLRAQYSARMSSDVAQNIADHGAWAGHPLETWLFLHLFEWASSRWDFATLKLARPRDTTDDRETNYLVVDDDDKGAMRIVVNNWKCAGSHATGQRVLEPPAPLQRLLKMYVRVTCKGYGDYLFVSARGGGPLSRDGMRKRVKGFFGAHFAAAAEAAAEAAAKASAEAVFAAATAAQSAAAEDQVAATSAASASETADAASAKAEANLPKVVTATLLRKIFATDKHADALEDMLDDAERHGHSLAEQHLYTKKRKRDA